MPNGGARTGALVLEIPRPTHHWMTVWVALSFTTGGASTLGIRAFFGIA
jgi:hypothetical protein